MQGRLGGMPSSCLGTSGCAGNNPLDELEVNSEAFTGWHPLKSILFRRVYEFRRRGGVGQIG